MSHVYLAQQRDLTRRLVVVKISRDPLSEVHNLAQLQHMNVMPVYSVHQAGPFTVLCMPFLGSTTLDHLLEWNEASKTGPLSGAAVVEKLTASRREPPAGHLASALAELQQLNAHDAVLWLMARVAEGLAHAHDQGILHLDLKPANILLSDNGRPLLLDFNV